ncbi:hypothetical protein P5673_025150 [Acropora cervicornis]|uniref:Uncharacterized protein n=1 Tax=Acropora cervicornis TaxID=6130 RepID=A0AAD9Q293_ACRCE|nr:hypothetical protein P5673_025150 [Acropora cervicornis]
MNPRRAWTLHLEEPQHGHDYTLKPEPKASIELNENITFDNFTQSKVSQPFNGRTFKQDRIFLISQGKVPYLSVPSRTLYLSLTSTGTLYGFSLPVTVVQICQVSLRQYHKEWYAASGERELSTSPPTVYGARAESYLDDPSVHQQQLVYDDRVTYEIVDECT